MSAPRVIHAREPARVASALLATAIARVQERKTGPRLAIPGGSALAALGPARAGLGSIWSGVRLTWVDERCVSEADAASNRGEAYRAGALRLDRPPAAELPLYLFPESPRSAVARVEATFDECFEGALDVLLLGMGEDGHIASLFPENGVRADARVAHVRGSPKPPAERITLTLPLLATAREAILMVTGESKREALNRLLEGDPALPATHLTGLVVVTDLQLEDSSRGR